MLSDDLLEEAFGRLPDGTAARRFTLNAGAVRATFTDFGARLVSVEAPDRNGRLAHVVLGFDAVETYVKDTTFLGATVGRYGNRIAHGRFTLDGVEYQLPLNNGPNTLHGGPEGFDRQLWQAHGIEGGIEFTRVSLAGEMGFPGALTVSVRYTLTEVPEGVALKMDYVATTDAATVVNVTNHAYYNLTGDRPNEPMQTVLEHEIEIAAEHFTPTDATMIPTGELASVAGTPFDFRQATRVGARVDQPDLQLEQAHGYDHTWVLGQTGLLKPAARLTEPVSGRTLTVETTEPGMQFYTGNHLPGLSPSRGGGVFGKRTGLCFETQHYPDSPNHAAFPSTVLRPGETLRSTTIVTFGVSA